MTRRTDGTWEMTAREFRSLTVFGPAIAAVFAAGAAWAGVRFGLDGKLDKEQFIHEAQQTALVLQSLHTADSLQFVVTRDLSERVREIVCPPNNRACR